VLFCLAIGYYLKIGKQNSGDRLRETPGGIRPVFIQVDKKPDRNADVYFMPIGLFPQHHMKAIEKYYKRFGWLRIEVLPHWPVLPEMVDGKRNQVIAEQLITQVSQMFRWTTHNPGAIVIGITPMDMFSVERDWNYVYVKREGSHCTVISSAHLTVNADGQRTDEETYLARTRKMITKTIGLQYYGLETNWDPASVMYSNVHGVEDLDRIDEHTMYRDIFAPGEKTKKILAAG
jgi:predicted Zn-dependent protease